MTAGDLIALCAAAIAILLWVGVQLVMARRWESLLAVLERIAWLLEADPDEIDPPGH